PRAEPVGVGLLLRRRRPEGGAPRLQPGGASDLGGHDRGDRPRLSPPRRPRARLGASPETAVRGGGGAVSASIRRRRVGFLDRPPRAAPHRRSDGAPASPLRYSASRACPTSF